MFGTGRALPSIDRSTSLTSSHCVASPIGDPQSFLRHDGRGCEHLPTERCHRCDPASQGWPSIATVAAILEMTSALGSIKVMPKEA